MSREGLFIAQHQVEKWSTIFLFLPYPHWIIVNIDKTEIRYQILESKIMCWYALKYYVANDENIYWGYWFGHLCQWIAVLDEPDIIWAIVLGQHEHIT